MVSPRMQQKIEVLYFTRSNMAPIAASQGVREHIHTHRYLSTLFERMPHRRLLAEVEAENLL